MSMLVFSACAKTEKAPTIPSKPEGMSEEQYTKTVGIIESAQKKIQESKDAFPYEAYLELGLYYQVLQDYDQSITALEKVLKEQPTNFNALNNIAVSYESKGDKQKALEYYGKLADAYPESWEALSDTLRLFKELDRKDDGIKVLEHFIQNYPETKDEKFNKFTSQMFEMLNAEKK